MVQHGAREAVADVPWTGERIVSPRRSRIGKSGRVIVAKEASAGRRRDSKAGESGMTDEGRRLTQKRVGEN